MTNLKRILTCCLIAALFACFGALPAGASAAGTNLNEKYGVYFQSWGFMEYDPGNPEDSTGPKARTAVILEPYHYGYVEAVVKTQSGWGNLRTNAAIGGFYGYLYTPWAYGPWDGAPGEKAQLVEHYGKYVNLLDPSEWDDFTFVFR